MRRLHLPGQRRRLLPAQLKIRDEDGGRMILHVGMHKTGTSSIQQALSSALTDDRFRFLKLGGFANGSLIVGNAYAEIDGYPHDPASPLELRRQARRFGMKLITSELNAFDERIPILSAEIICSLGEQAKRAFLDMLSRYYPDVRIAAYVRRPKSYVESAYQERLKHSLVRVDDLVEDVSYRRIFSPFEELLGRSAVSLRLFDRQSLLEGDVVTDFAACFGIVMNKSTPIRENETLSLDAVKLLYIYRLFNPVFRDSDSAVISLLSTIQGGRFAFQHSVFERAAIIGGEDIEWVNERLNVQIDVCPDTTDGGISSDADMLSLRPESLDVLSQRLGVRPSTISGGPHEIATALAGYRDAA
jgi:hypothetical protein